MLKTLHCARTLTYIKGIHHHLLKIRREVEPTSWRTSGSKGLGLSLKGLVTGHGVTVLSFKKHSERRYWDEEYLWPKDWGRKKSLYYHDLGFCLGKWNIYILNTYIYMYIYYYTTLLHIFIHQLLQNDLNLIRGLCFSIRIKVGAMFWRIRDPLPWGDA